MFFPLVPVIFNLLFLQFFSFIMRFSSFSFCLIILLWLPACKSRYSSVSDYPKAQLVFGQGGGFAGTVQTYHLLQDGAVFSAPPEGTTGPQKINQVSKSTAKALFAQAESLSLETRSLRQPGNRYAFIEWRTPETQNRVVWDLDNPGKGSDLMPLHQKLMQQTVAVQ